MIVAITGAGSGLGREFSLALAKRGATLWLSDIQLAALQETADLALTAGAKNVHSLYCDVSNRESLQNFAHKLRSESGKLDLLINNAGVATAGNISDIPESDWQWCMNVNLWSVIWGCQIFLPLLEQSTGRILNIASSAGLFAPPALSPYNVSKAGVIALSQTLYYELKPKGIHVSVACPMFFNTNIARNARIHNPTIPPLASHLIQNSGITAQKIAERCLMDLDRKTFLILPSWDARFLWFANRWMPQFFSIGFRYILNRLQSKFKTQF